MGGADLLERESSFLPPPGPNPLNHRYDFSRLTLRQWILNLLFQAALHLPSYERVDASAVWVARIYWMFLCELVTVQGELAYKKPHPPRTLPQANA